MRVLLPSDDETDDAAAMHLRPASVEHLLAVNCIWSRMDPADRQVLSSCYTPRETPHACGLTTLYVPISETPHSGTADIELMGAVRRLRPLQLPELLELLRIYVIREPHPTAATLALPLAPAGDERAAELRTHDSDEVLGHVYCTLTGAGSASASGSAPVMSSFSKEAWPGRHSFESESQAPDNPNLKSRGH